MASQAQKFSRFAFVATSPFERLPDERLLDLFEIHALWREPEWTVGRLLRERLHTLGQMDHVDWAGGCQADCSFHNPAQFRHISGPGILLDQLRRTHGQ